MINWYSACVQTSIKQTFWQFACLEHLIVRKCNAKRKTPKAAEHTPCVQCPLTLMNWRSVKKLTKNPPQWCERRIKLYRKRLLQVIAAEGGSFISSQPSVSLRDLGLSEIRVSQLDELVSRLLPIPGPEEPPAVPSIWRTSHVSADNFFHNKHGELLRRLSSKTKQLHG